MSTYELLLERYSRIIAGASTESIKEAEIQVARMELELDFVPTNAAIICELSNPITIRKFAAVYLSKYSKKIVKQKIIQKSTNAFQQYMNILKVAHLEIEIKTLIVSPIEIVINSEPNRALKQLFLAEYIKLMNEANNQEDFDVNFAFLVFCGQSILIRDAYNEQIKEIVKNTMGPLIKLTIRLLLRASIEQTLENRQNSVLLLRLIKEYSALLKQYFKRMALLDIECMKILFLPELESLITLALHFNYKENEINSTLYTSISNDELISKLVNIIKAHFVVMLTNFIRLMFTFTKHANLYSNNQLYLKIPDILKYFIQSTSSLLQRVPFYQLPHKIMILETLDEVLNFFISCLRVSNFYQSFYEYKSDLIEHIILPCLSLTPGDIENFYEDSQQFVHNTLQIVSRDLRIPNSSIQNQDPEDQIKQYETLRTLAAQFLNTFCKFQDGTLSHVVDYATGVLNGTHQGPRSLVFLIICILANQFKERKDIKTRISQIILQMIRNCPLPVLNGTRKEEDIEYAYLLLTLSKIYFFAIESYPDIINISYKVGVSVIQSPSVNEVHKYFVFQMFNNLAKIQEATQYVQDIISIYNHLLKSMPEPSIHLLESYFLLIKYNPQQLKKSPSSLIEALKYVCLHIERQVQKPQPTQILLCKCWNVIRQVGQGEDFIPALIAPIQEMIVPLLQYIDGVRNLDFEEDVLMLLTSFIQKGKKVTVNQQKMFQIIPRIFYNQYNRRFGHSFYAIQLFIYYGSDVLRQNYQAIESIIDMSLVSISTLQCNKKPMNETQNCQGALILQSLILKCGNIFNVDSWSKIITTVQRRLNEGIIRFNLLTSNLYALLSLSLIHSYRFFSNEQNEILMSKILSEMRVFTKILYSPKVIIAGLTELLMLSDCEFIWRRFTQILDTVITMLEITSVKKENYFEEDQDEEKQYSNSVIMVKNDLKMLDQFTFFRQQVEKLKLKNLPLLQKSVGELPKTKKEFFTHILRIERVANEPRQIYKIKR